MPTQLDTLPAQVADRLRRHLDIELPEDLVARILGSAGLLDPDRRGPPALDSLVELYADEVERHCGSRYKDSGGKYAAAMVIGACAAFALAVAISML